MCGLLLPELHLDRLCRFCMTRQCAKDAQTDKCTTKRATTVEIGRINDHDLAEWLACWTQAQKAWVQIKLFILGKLFTPIVPLFTKQRNW